MDHPALRVVNQALLYTNSMRIHTMMREMHMLVFMYLRDAYYTLWGNHINIVLSLPCYCYGRYNTIAFDNAQASRHAKHWADDKINISGGIIKERCPLSCIYPYSRCHVAQIADQ